MLARLSPLIEHGILHVLFLHESRNGGLLARQAFFVARLKILAFRRDADDFETLRRVFILQFDQPRRLDLAGAAPRCPEVDQQGLALEAGERNGPAAQVFEDEVGRGLADERRLTLRNIAGSHGNELGMRSRGKRALGRLLAILPVGPSSPGKGGQNEQCNADNDGVALHGGQDLFVSIVRGKTVHGEQ